MATSPRKPSIRVYRQTRKLLILQSLSMALAELNRELARVRAKTAAYIAANGAPHA